LGLLVEAQVKVGSFRHRTGPARQRWRHGSPRQSDPEV
jgi:hypothetical protein